MTKDQNPAGEGCPGDAKSTLHALEPDSGAGLQQGRVCCRGCLPAPPAGGPSGFGACRAGFMCTRCIELNSSATWALGVCCLFRLSCRSATGHWATGRILRGLGKRRAVELPVNSPNRWWRCVEANAWRKEGCLFGSNWNSPAGTLQAEGNRRQEGLTHRLFD